MTDEFKRESHFWFKKSKNEEGEKTLGEAQYKDIDFTLIANGRKLQAIDFDLGPYEGQRNQSASVNFNKAGVTMNILVTVLSEEEFNRVRPDQDGGCCTIF